MRRRAPAFLSVVPLALAVAPRPGGPVARAAPADAVDFVRDVKPILDGACVGCHGPDKRKGGLRLDSRAELLEGGLSGPAIEPGKGDGSLLLARVRGQGGEERMPPKESGPALTAAQIATLRRWIDQGAVWPGAVAARPAAAPVHWAYAKPVRPEPPPVKTKGWVRGPIDAFILARLEKEGLAPAPEADGETLLRRVTLDLTGLPPSAAEIEAWRRDRRPNAYDALVDRLLASPRYGERWARLWLDLARYADSNGYEKDRPRVAWKYRDWVIDALNRNLSFRQFTIEQIAGDMLPGATEAQRIATGFHRNTLLNQEGGIDVEEARWETLVDRVGTTATTWLGSTLACAQCHNHKYDPFTQRDFFKFLAFFDNVPYEVGGWGVDRWIEEPKVHLPSPAQKQERDRLEAEIASLEARLQVKTPEARAAMRAFEESVRAAERDWAPVTIARARSKGGATLQLGKAGAGAGALLAAGPNPEADVYEIDATTTTERITGIRLEVLGHPSLPAGGPGRNKDGNFFLSELSVRVAPLHDEGVGEPLKFRAAFADEAVSSSTVDKLLRRDGDDGWAVDVTQTPRPKRRQAIFVLDGPVGGGAGTRLLVRLAHQMPRTARNLGHFRLSVTSAADPSLAALVPTRLRRALEAPEAQRSPAEQKELESLYGRVAPGLAPIRDRIAALRQAVADLKIPSALVMDERPSFERPSTHLRVRGSFMEKGEVVYASTPKIFPPLPESAPANRLGLARWLVDDENPLTARVTVNRFWEQYFGHGIVETSEDFGTQGSPPSHPELLDWLATELVRTGWDMKALHKTIVTSATYRQASRATPALLEKDPYNRLYARGPRFRLDAEAIRDVALHVGGLLSPKIGGPSVFPPQPEGIWNVPYSSDQWVTSKGEDRHRRGLYTFIRRSSPYPSMVTFDAPSREACTARRVRTNTPLQALTTLNDPAFFEAAQALARRVVAEAPADPAARATHGFRLCTARAPGRDELAPILAFYRAERARLERDPAAAAKLAGIPDALARGGAPAAELAAWTVVANVLLNLDETITKE